jgi:serine/threonine protein kinase
VVPDEEMIESCGTPAYVAPEVLHRKGYRKQVDMWSAGVIFYTLVCRQLPFQSQDRKTTFNQIKEKQPDMDNFAFRRFSKETKDIIKQMLQKIPERRITPANALKHRYFVRNGLAKSQIEFDKYKQIE